MPDKLDKDVVSVTSTTETVALAESNNDKTITLTIKELGGDELCAKAVMSEDETIKLINALRLALVKLYEKEIVVPVTVNIVNKK